MGMKSICTDNPGIANLLMNNGVYVDKPRIVRFEPVPGRSF